MYKIEIWGIASKKLLLAKNINKIELNVNTLSWLRENNIPIASSCDGDGVCKKCTINQDILSCQTTLKDLLNSQGTIKIEVSYL